MKIEWVSPDNLCPMQSLYQNLVPVVQVKALEQWIKNQIEEPMDLTTAHTDGVISAYLNILDKLASLKEQP